MEAVGLPGIVGGNVRNSVRYAVGVAGGANGRGKSNVLLPMCTGGLKTEPDI